MKSMLGVLALVCAAGAGCGGGPSCEEAAKHLMELRAKDSPDMTPEKKAERTAKMTKKCEEKKPSASALKCVMAASDMEAVEKCNPDNK